jgi:hypothetical protein
MQKKYERVQSLKEKRFQAHSTVTIYMNSKRHSENYVTEISNTNILPEGRQTEMVKQNYMESAQETRNELKIFS